MSKVKILGCMLLVLLAAAVILPAADNNENIVSRTGGKAAWPHSGTVVPAGENGAGDLSWSGNTLKFVPENGEYSLEKTEFFSFMLRVPESMKKQKFRVTLLYQDGQKQSKFATPNHTGWQRYVIRSLGKRGKQPILKEILFEADDPGFQAFLRDVRLLSGVINHDFPEDRVSPVTNGCFFPANTLDITKAEVLADPEFAPKMQEIGRLRRSKLRVEPDEVKTDPAELTGIPLYARIRPDGTYEGMSYEDMAGRLQKSKRPGSINQLYISDHIELIKKLLSAWEKGRVPRTAENRDKLFRLMNRILSAECNMQGEPSRYVVCSFLLPQLAVKAYGVFFDEMEAVENGSCQDPETIRLNRLLKEVASWCFMDPDDHPTAPCLTMDFFRFSSAFTGGNFSYRPTFLAALVCRNPQMLDVISEVAKNCLSVVSFNTMKDAYWLDGITADGSAWGHTSQNYPFGYPMDGLRGIGKLIGELSGSRWEIKPDGPSFDHLCGYMEALTWYGTGWADSGYLKKADYRKLLQRDIPTACGRRGMRYNPGRGYDDFSKAVETLELFRRQLPDGSPQKKRLDTVYGVMTGEKPLPVGSRYFWNNDLLICREKDSIIAVAMLSSRVRSVECAPSGSHYTDFWSDGAAWIMKHFDSYRTARGFFDPCAIPGVTARQFEYTHTGKKWNTYRGGYNFAGGAADGNYAVCGFRMGRNKKESSWSNPDPRFYDLVAEKTYFRLNGILVCLGSGIDERSQATGAEIKPLEIPIATTLDQTLWRGPASFGQNETKKPGETFQADTQMLWHDGVGYWILNGRGVLSGETKKGRWTEFDPYNEKIKDRPKSAPILTFQIDHGKTVKDGSYTYAVDLHCPDFAALKKRMEEPPFEIVSATSDVHAVREKSSGTLAAVFFKPGEAGGLKVDAPAVALLRPAPDGKILMTVSDPEQDPKRESVTLGWNGKKYRIQLPSGTYCGQPVTVDLSKLEPLKDTSK